MNQRFLNALQLLFCVLAFSYTIKAQRVVSLLDGIQVDSILQAKPWASKMAFDPISKHLFYTSSSGNIYEVFEAIQTDSLRYSSVDHGIAKVQGLCFVDSTLFVCGNIWYTSTGIGLVVKGELQPNGTREWTTILSTAAYPTSSASGDHGFTGISADPQKAYLYFSAGARTSFGEVVTNNGQYPGMREQALTSKIFRIPISATNIYLYNDSTWLHDSGYVFAEGTRNAYSMAFNGENQLFAIDNAGERDDPEELNLIIEGQHYGFPWRIGGNANPLINPNYDASSDPLINPNNGAFLAGHFAPDPSFPAQPSGINFKEPIANYGTAADYFKDEATGTIQKASEIGIPVRTFTAHRSPLGLVIDRDSLLGGPFCGNGLVLSFMPGGDSSGFSPISPWGSPCPFVDPSRELVLLQFVFDTITQEYHLQTNNVVSGFYLPVDAVQVENAIYVIENNGDLFKITLPKKVIEPNCFASGLFVYPNPAQTAFAVYFPNPENASRYLEITNVAGEVVYKSESFQTADFQLANLQIAKGSYLVSIVSHEGRLAQQKIVLL
ncbi:MAG: T9SS type A sorting domain-containing protein [Sphingomonadales bacterium]